MIKNFKLIVLLILCLSVGLWAQTVILSDEFDAGDGKWTSGWIEPSTVVTFSIDTNSVLSGKNSYLADITNASATTYNIQRNANAPLLAGNKYTLSFMAVTDKEGASINVLFEIAGDPYTKRLNVIETIATTPTVYTYKVIATEDVPTNQVKLHYGGTQNNGAKIWIDNVVVTEEVDTGPISDWGEDGLGYAWAVLNDSNTVAGSAGMAGTQPMATNGSSLFGGFDTLQATTDQAVVVSGQLEFIGSPGPVYTALRFALTFLDSLSLQHQYTDSARWIGAKGVGYYGYEFTPRSGGGTQPNGSGGNGSVWSIINGNWPSTYSNGGGPIGPVVNQAPRNATIVAGTYDWAVSVHAVDDTTNEIRWSLVKTDNKYWFAGSVIDTAVTTKFNGIGFWTKEGEHTQVNITNARAELGNPITIPEAPFEEYYLGWWGEDGLGYAWSVLNDSDTVVGNGSIAGTQPMATNGSSLFGGFGQDVNIPTNKAVVVEGELEFVGSPGPVYTALRFAITYLDSLTLQHQYTDTARWIGAKGAGYYGYEFTPRSGGGTQPNGSGGNGSVWSIINGNWPSTYSNGGGPVGPVVNQAPRNATIVAGTYEWAVSVQQVNDSTNEVRWSLVKDDNKYWFAGTVLAPAVTNKLNGIGFWTKEGEHTQMNITNAKINLGNPIPIPEAPFEEYYLGWWGEDGLGYAWSVLNDSDTVVGNGSIAGTQPMATNGSSLFGGFGQDVNIPTNKAVVVEGELEFVGSPGPVYTALRFAITYLDSLTLQHQYTDTARWIGAKGVGYYGYEFTPRSGGGTQPNGSGGNGSVWSIINGNWPSTYSNGGGPVGPVVDQSPRNATILEGTYEWAVSVQQVNDTTNEVRWSLYKTDDKYLFAGTVLAPAVTNKLNGIGFWTKEGEHTQMNITNAKINLGAPIPIPEPIWEDYYVDQWGFIGNRIGGWTNETGTYVGDFSLSGAAAPTDWSAVRGGFDPVELKENEILVLEGDIELVGGGFQDWSSLRLGLFYSDSAGTVTQDPALDSSYVWTGVETHHSGYLFSPHSGTNAIPTWSGTEGTYGAIIDGNWISTNTGTGYVLGTKTQVPAGAVAGAATYAFKMGVQLLEDGTIDLRMQLMNGDDYVWEISTIDANDPLATTKFNCVCFAINNTTTTAMHLKNVEVTKPDEWFILDIEQEVFDLIPTVYSLSQNYPNPFNPSTTIKFGLPKNSEVKLVVYDVLGQVVAQLAKKDMTAGYHTVTFSASRFSSGIYFYRIEAGDFVKTKKMMLLK